MRCPRVDLVGQFDFSPADFILAHRAATHPAIRGRKIFYEGESLTFPGRERRCVIYDKIKKATGKPGLIARAEWQLHGAALRHDFGGQTMGLQTLRVEKCYKVYRRLCMGFAPARVPVVSGMASLLALAASENFCIQGIPFFDIWMRGKHPKTVQRVRREIQRQAFKTLNFDWQQLLPERFDDFPIINAA